MLTSLELMLLGPVFGFGAIVIYYTSCGVVKLVKKHKTRQERKEATPIYNDYGQLLCSCTLKQAVKMAREAGAPGKYLIQMTALSAALNSQKMDKQKVANDINLIRSGMFMDGFDDVDVDYLLGEAAGGLNKEYQE